MRITLIIMAFFLFSGFQQEAGEEKVYNVLIISGSNNHDWKKTTPFLNNLLVASGYFRSDVTNRPDTLNYNTYKKYDVVISNWNSWPENDLRWPEETENGLLKYVEDGGGLLFFHSSTSAFYKWPGFKNISTAAWTDSTWHKKRSPVKVMSENHEHPITKGLSDFYTFDELWVNAEQNEKFQVLGSAINENLLEKGLSKQPAIFVSGYGKGRIFHTILGHDVRAMQNTGFQTLLLRAAEWAASGKVTQPVPQELMEYVPVEETQLSWVENDTTLALLDNERILWQFNFNTKYDKPFFHPIFVKRNMITCLSPDDHPWHLGQWFSWKYINDKNYWEYIDKNFHSEGITDIKSIMIRKEADHSAKITMEIEYHPENEKTVLKETRIIRVSPPQKDGSVLMDYNMDFEAVADSVVLDRTPLVGEPGGKSWGGYAGLSIRFNQDFMNSRFVSSFGDNINVNGKTGDYLYMGFKGIDGKQVGSVIMIPEVSKRDGEAWYTVNSQEIPFYYLSPAYLYFKPKTLTKGEHLILKYRIKHIEGDVSTDTLNTEYEKYLNWLKK